MTMSIHSTTFAAIPIALIIATPPRSATLVRFRDGASTQNPIAAPPQSAICQSSTSFATGAKNWLDVRRARACRIRR